MTRWDAPAHIAPVNGWLKLHPMLERRDFLLGSGAAGMLGCLPAASAAAQSTASGYTVSVTQFGARSGLGQDNSRAIQAAIDDVQRRGGGTVLVPGRFRCGNLRISGSGVRIQGQDGWLVDGRLTIEPAARNIEIVDLGLLDTRANSDSYLADISGQNCRFHNLQLVKDPIAGGYQMYIRQSAAGCRFTGLRLKGSNGVMVAGRDHSFVDFEFESTMAKHVGGDDAFAIKGLEGATANIEIRNGVVRGYSNIASFGSEVGTPGRASNFIGSIRNVTVENVTADRCSGLIFFKPGALIYDWRNGLVEGIRLRNLVLTDPAGERFTSGIRMLAARGAVIRDVIGTGLAVRARAAHRGQMPTAAIDLSLFEQGAPGTIENIELQMSFIDPHDGAAHGPGAPGYPVDHIVRVEKTNPARGSISGITLDIEGRGAGIGGVYVGAGLDDAVNLRRAILTQVATNPPASVGGGGIWSDSRLTMGQVKVDSIKLPAFGGRAFGKTPG